MTQGHIMFVLNHFREDTAMSGQVSVTSQKKSVNNHDEFYLIFLNKNARSVGVREINGLLMLSSE